MDKPSYYAVIPASVRYDERLSAAEKLLYGELTALANQKGYCYPSNQFLAELYGAKERTVQQWIANLAKCGYIAVALQKDEGAGGQPKRRIYIGDTLEKGVQKSAPHAKICAEGVQKSAPDTLLKNNTRYNNTPLTPQEGETVRRRVLSPEEEELAKATGYYDANIQPISPGVFNMIRTAVENYGLPLVLEAEKIAVQNNAHSWGYCKSILERWRANMITRPDQIADLDRREPERKGARRRELD